MATVTQTMRKLLNDPEHVATCTGWTLAIDGTPTLAHQARKSSAAR